MRLVVVSLLIASAGLVLAGQESADRAHLDYMLYCQGCHTPDGVGAEGVPRLKGHIGVFLDSPAGREYLVRVPGSANSVLPDARLAEVLNWMVLQFGGDSVSQPFRPYQAREVGVARARPLDELAAYRAALLTDLNGDQLNTGAEN